MSAADRTVPVSILTGFLGAGKKTLLNRLLKHPELTDTAVVDYFTQKINCAEGIGDDIEQYATGGTSLRYDTTGGQFIFNWQTPKQRGACYRVTMQTLDGTRISATFQLK